MNISQKINALDKVKVYKGSIRYCYTNVIGLLFLLEITYLMYKF